MKSGSPKRKTGTRPKAITAVNENLSKARWHVDWTLLTNIIFSMLLNSAEMSSVSVSQQTSL